MSEEQQQLTPAQVISMTEERFKKVAPANMQWEAEFGYAVQLMTNNGYLATVAKENPQSLQQAMTNVAAIGLSLNPAKKQAYLIPRNVKEGKQWVSKIFLEPSYMGMCDIATASGMIEWVQSNYVYSNDTFVDNGPGLRPTHTYNAFDSEEKRGEFVGVYCVAKTKGDYLTSIMPAEEVYSIRGRSEAYKSFIEKKRGNGGPWVTDFKEQAKKSVVRRAFKMWPKTHEMERMEQAVHISNENEGFTPIINNPEIRDYTADQKAFFDQLITNNDAIGMELFMSSLPEGVQISLYNSFEKGSKGKYQAIMEKLQASGRQQLIDCQIALEDAEQAQDDLAAKEVLAELSQDAVNAIILATDEQTREFINSCQSEGEPE